MVYLNAKEEELPTEELRILPGKYTWKELMFQACCLLAIAGASLILGAYCFGIFAEAFEAFAASYSLTQIFIWVVSFSGTAAFSCLAGFAMYRIYCIHGRYDTKNFDNRAVNAIVKTGRTVVLFVLSAGLFFAAVHEPNVAFKMTATSIVSSYDTIFEAAVHLYVFCCSLLIGNFVFLYACSSVKEARVSMRLYKALKQKKPLAQHALYN